jgi:hypothetical protein
LAEELQAFYAANGFRLFGGAYSEHRHTVNAIPQILNFGTEQPWKPRHKDGATVENNAYFDRLHELGYEIIVRQTEFLDFCSSETVRSCNRYSSAGVEPIHASTLSTGEKAAVLLYTFMSLSEVATTVVRAYDGGAAWLVRRGVEIPLVEIDRHRRTSTMSALVAVDRLIADLRQARSGQAYFTHLLLPHYPYATNRDCTLKARKEWQMRVSLIESRKRRQLAYFDQLSCTTKKLGAVLESLAASPAGARSIVIVHGDHGSRITQRDPTVKNSGLVDDTDLISSYATLFAVKAPEIAPGYDARRLPVARLLASLAGSGFQSVEVELESGFIPSVVLDDHEWRPGHRIDLPPSWIPR